MLFICPFTNMILNCCQSTANISKEINLCKWLHCNNERLFAYEFWRGHFNDGAVVEFDRHFKQVKVRENWFHIPEFYLFSLTLNLFSALASIFGNRRFLFFILFAGVYELEACFRMRNDVLLKCYWYCKISTSHSLLKMFQMLKYSILFMSWVNIVMNHEQSIVFLMCA